MRLPFQVFSVFSTTRLFLHTLLSATVLSRRHPP